MLILSLDSAGAGCSACVWRDGRILSFAEERMERGQDARLIPLILDVMKQAGVAFDALDRVAVTRGPGSFTGLRIGLAAARGIGLAAGKPVIGLDRFAVYREQFKTADKNLFVVIDSKREELFCRFYPVSGVAEEPAMMTPDEIIVFLKDKKDVMVTGDINSCHSRLRGDDNVGFAFTNPPEKEVVTCAALAARADANDPAYLPRPLYLRAPDVTLKRA